MIEGPSLLEKGVEILKGVYSTMFRVREVSGIVWVFTQTSILLLMGSVNRKYPKLRN